MGHLIKSAFALVFVASFCFTDGDVWALDIDFEVKMIEDDEKPRGFVYGYYPDRLSTSSRRKVTPEMFEDTQKQYLEYLEKLSNYEEQKESQSLVELQSALRAVFSNNDLGDFFEAYQAGGVQGSVVGTLIRDITLPIRHCNSLNTGSVSGWEAALGKPELVESTIRVYTNDILQNGYVRLNSQKKFKCKKTGQADKEFSVKRRWVVSVLRGLYHVDHPSSAYKYEISALGKQIRLMGYYELIEAWPAPTATQPTLILPSNKEMGQYYIPSNRSCLHVRFAVKPPNGQLTGPSTPSNLEFCASGCIPGDVDGTL